MLTTSNPFALPPQYYVSSAETNCHPIPAQIPLGASRRYSVGSASSNQKKNMTTSKRSETERNRSNRRFKCNYCGKRYESAALLSKHLLKHENKVRPFLCVSCGKAFAKISKLKSHCRRREHMMQEPSTDDVCQPPASSQKERKSRKMPKQTPSTRKSKEKRQCCDGKDSVRLIPVSNSNCYYCTVCDKVITYKLRHRH